MSLAVESAQLLREIHELRARRQRQLDLDLAEIDRAYEQELCTMRRARRRGLIVNACLWTTTLVIVAAMFLAI